MKNENQSFKSLVEISRPILERLDVVIQQSNLEEKDDDNYTRQKR